MKKSSLGLASLAGIYAASAVSSVAAPTVAQFNPIAVYVDVRSSFGLAYDNVNNVIHSSEFGGSTVHSLQPYKDFSVADLSLLPVIGGLKVISPAAGKLDVKGTTSLSGIAGGEEIGFDSAIGQLVMRSGSKFVSFDPFTAANKNLNYANAPVSILHDGLDVSGGVLWSSQDGFTGAIYKNGVLFATEANAAQTFLPTFSGVGPKNTDFWAGVQGIGDSLYAVAVHDNNNAAGSRTIVRFDAKTGELLSYDPDGDVHAGRWEGLGFDGKFLYAADFTAGDRFGSAGLGNVYVFELQGDLRDPILIPPGPPTDPGAPVPEVGTTASALAFAGLSGFAWLRRRKHA